MDARTVPQTQTTDDINAAQSVWQGIAQVAEAFWQNCKEVGRVLGEHLIAISKATWAAIRWTASKCWAALAWINSRIILPTFVTGINILGYFADKILYGSPALRPYLEHGLLPSTIAPSWRNWVRNNSGWDIYESIHPVADNILGVLGLGVGFLNMFSHLAASVINQIKNSWHLLGNYGVFGERKFEPDPRPLALKIVFGSLATFISVPFILFTNLCDASFTFIKHLILSFTRNTRVTFNLLGENGVFGKREEFKDERGLAAKIVYGIFSFPFVLVAATLTNLIDGLFAFIKNLSLSFWHNLRVSVNLLGKHGIFGERLAYEDERGLPAKISYGILTGIFVGAVAAVSNTFDFICTFAKHLALSFWRNLQPVANLLGENGVIGKRPAYVDDRHLAIRIIGGILSAPFVAMAAIVSNACDIAATFIKHLSISIWHNLRPNFNLFGAQGLFGDRRPYEDKRHMGLKIFFGIISFPFVVTAAIVTNLLDSIFIFGKHCSWSILHNYRATCNFLGDYGVFKMRRSYEDDRGLFAKIFYGIITSPFVLLLSGTTNLFNLALTIGKHCGISFARNLKATWNFLGDYGHFTIRNHFEDSRNLFAKITFGILTAPLVAIVATTINLANVLATLIKHTYLSFTRNLSPIKNLLGSYGIQGTHYQRTYADDRGLLAKIFYGILSAPFVALAALLTNAWDAFATLTKHLCLSYWHNSRVTFNIILGSVGMFGSRRQLNDNRNLLAKIVYGILTVPFVLSTVLLTNAIDLVVSYFANHKKTIREPFLKGTGVGIVSILALPGFIIRKTFKGLYNFTLYPIINAAKGKAIQPLRIIKGIANFVTLGGFSAVKKVFEKATGYSSRFGFPVNLMERPIPVANALKNENDELIFTRNYYLESQKAFKSAIDFATQGKFPGVLDGLGVARPVIRLFFGLRHKVEEIVKTLHDVYQSYVKELPKETTDYSNVAYSMHKFFASNKFQDAKQQLKNTLREGEGEIMDQVETRLMHWARC